MSSSRASWISAKKQTCSESKAIRTSYCNLHGSYSITSSCVQLLVQDCESACVTCFNAMVKVSHYP